MGHTVTGSIKDEESFNDVEELLVIVAKVAKDARARAKFFWKQDASMFIPIDAHILIFGMSIIYRKSPRKMADIFAELVTNNLREKYHHKEPKVRYGKLRIHVDL